MEYNLLMWEIVTLLSAYNQNGSESAIVYVHKYISNVQVKLTFKEIDITVGSLRNKGFKISFKKINFTSLKMI